MKMEINVLGKNFYSMEGNEGANLVVYGDYENTNNKVGISISEAVIDFSEHDNINVFPAKYRASANLVATKSRNGKNITSLKLSNLELIEKVKLVPDLVKK